MKRLVILAIALVAVLLLIAPVSGCASEGQLTEAYNVGYQAGYEEAYSVAYEEGHSVGYDEGHIVGYNTGRAEVKRSMEQSLQELRRELEAAYRQVEKPTYGSMFFFYYTPLKDQEYGVKNLEECLDRTWKEGLYKANVFDCSEMSAFLEWYLENEGWHTKIMTGKAPDGSGLDHAWLMVETSESGYMPVEATAWAIVYWDNPYFENYFEYPVGEFETIQEVMEYAPEEFNWWASKD